MVSNPSTSTSNTNTTRLYQKILFPPSNKHLPPRILHSSHHVILDPILLDLIALICREHVLTWYGNISKDPNRDFIRQITSIIIHVIQTLEVRLVQMDLVELIVLDLPSLLDKHIQDFNQSIERANTAHAHNLNPDQVFHSLQPHIAISLSTSPSGNITPQVDKIYLRALMDNLLSILLPLEDYTAETERTLVKEIIVNVILGSVFEKVTQPWFLYQAIAKILEARELEIESKNIAGRGSNKSSNYSTQTTSNLILSRLASVPTFLSAVSLTITTIYRTIISSPVPSHYSQEPPITSPILNLIITILPPSSMINQLIHYMQIFFSIFSTFFTSLIFYLFHEKVFKVELVESILLTTTNSLFPNGHPPAKEEDPNEEEQELIKKRCELAVSKVLPPIISKICPIDSTLPLSQQQLLLAQHLLKPLSSHISNVHLFVLLIDLIVGKVFPEMVEEKIDL